MNFTEYQKLAARTINRELNADDMTRHAVFGLCSEAGEVAGIYQKYYQGHSVDIEHVVKEMGDCLWMLAELCTANGLSLSEVASENIAKLMARFPDGFETEKSLHRSENDI